MMDVIKKMQELVEELKSAPEMTDQEVQEHRRQHPEEYVQCEECGRWDQCSPCDDCYEEVV